MLQVVASKWSFLNIDRAFATEVVRCMRLATLPGLDKKCKLRFLDKDGCPKDEISSIINKFHSIKKASRKPICISAVSLFSPQMKHPTMREDPNGMCSVLCPTSAFTCSPSHLHSGRCYDRVC